MEFLLERDRSSNHLIDYIKNIYDNQIAFDVLLLAESSQFKAHRSVLAATSQFFNFILKEQLGDDLVVSLAEYSGLHVKKMLEFIYTGMTTISTNDEHAFTQLLTNLEIGGTKATVTVENNHFIQTTNDDGTLIETERPINSIENIKSLKCEICGQVLKTRTGLRMHLLVHQGSKGKVFTCDVCGKGFSQASQLKTHMRIHTGEKPYKCNVCGKSFSHASTLSEHKNLHDEVKPFQCNVCKQSFAQRKALRSHSCQEDASNTKSKIGHCPYCNRTFSTRRGLAIHKMHQHAETSNEPILQCDLCSSTFSSELAYETHIQQHT